MSSILVVGAVLVRPETLSSPSPAKKQNIDEIQSLGIKIQSGDFIVGSASELAVIFQPFDIIIQCAGYGMPKGTQVKVTQAALQAKVPRFFPWQFGLDFDQIPEASYEGMFDDNKLVRKMLREQEGIDWTVVSNGLFMSYLFLPSFGVVDAKKRVVRALGSWENKTAITLPEDIGKMVAEVVYAPSKESPDHMVYLSGDTITYSRLADLVEEHFKIKFTRELWTIPKLKEDLENDPGNLWKKYRVVFATGHGVFWGEEESFNVKRQIPLTSVPDYLEHNGKMIEDLE
ncbi:NmrA domain-containing protein [Fusarium sp. LHS14.1]|nr:NmrA domain-containing protein [Fusarium sp. LHS14.1]